MKRLLFRLSALAVVIVLGGIAIAQVQRGGNSPKQEPKRLSSAVARNAKPIPIRDAESSAAVQDPFAARTGSGAGKTRSAAQVGTATRRSLKAAPSASDDDSMAVEPAYAEASNPQRLEAQADGTDQLPAADPFGLHAAAGGESSAQFAERPAAAESDAEELAPEQASDDGTSPFAPTPATAAQQEEADGTFSEANPAGMPLADTTSESAFAAQPEAFPGNSEALQPVDAIPSPAPSAEERGEGTGKPGPQQLEGSQTPTLMIEKQAPAEIQVGKPATFVIKVRNTGAVTAQQVEVHDEIPQGTQLVRTTPEAKSDPAGKLVWELGTIKPGDEVTAQVELLPIAEGEIGSVATVHFSAEASVRTVATKPELTLDVTAPKQVMIGENVALKIKISNPGTGAASGVVLTETVPAELKHSAGGELEFDVGTLKPGEQRELELVLTAAAAGPVTNVLTAKGDANLQAEGRAEFEVVAPALKVELTGPKRRYLERKATYNISVVNPGTAAAKDVELVTVLPKGLKFVDANNAGQYDAATHSVYWSLEELPAQETGSVMLTALPVEPGELKLQIKGRAKQGLADEHDETILVDGLAALQFELVDVHDPVEINGETTYEIRVTNQGSKAATNIRLAALLPAEMQAVSADGPVRYSVDGQRVLFEPLGQLAPKADTTYTVKVKAMQPGDLRIRVQMVSDGIRTPITKEESTRVYADE